MRLQTSLSLAKANAIVTGALRLGREAGMLPLTVVALDAGGKLIAAQSEDGSGLLRFRHRLRQGVGRARHGHLQPPHPRPARRPARPSRPRSPPRRTGRFVPVPGGVLVQTGEGVTIGAVGVSGDTSEKDEYCAVEAIRSAGLAPEPAEPDPDWRGSSLSDR